ncbi:hypothetical protein JYT54_00005, partial [bacterium AH-315-A03]|nr:hypothetical protein [bacterium AH-315-A03]
SLPRIVSASALAVQVNGRRSQSVLLLELAQRLEWAELAGEPEQIHSSFVVGLKHLPMRYRIRPAAL